jgi:hypothetical protein
LGPEAAHLCAVYLQTPRALVWRNASSEWPLLILILPMASRFAMMRNPIFANLVRDWGLNVRFIGVDHDHRIFDFRKLLTDSLLGKLITALDQRSSIDRRQANEQDGNATLDLLFSALSQGMLTILETRRVSWPEHLARSHRLEPNVSGTLFDRVSRFSDFTRALQQALRDRIIDPVFYGRALRAFDLREESIEYRLSQLIHSTLDPLIIERLKASTVGQHLGCYNWMALEPNRTAQRHYMLQRLGCFAQFFCDALLTQQDITCEVDATASVWPQGSNDSGLAQLAQAVDSGQDRLVIQALANRFAVQANTIRNLWRISSTEHSSAALGTPNHWHLQKILLRLDELGVNAWPKTPEQWLRFKSL